MFSSVFTAFRLCPGGRCAYLIVIVRDLRPSNSLTLGISLANLFLNIFFRSAVTLAIKTGKKGRDASPPSFLFKTYNPNYLTFMIDVGFAFTTAVNESVALSHLVPELSLTVKDTMYVPGLE